MSSTVAQIEQLIDSDDVSPETASKISDLLDSLRASMLDVRRQIFSAVSADVNSSKEKNKAAEGLLVSEEILALKAAKLKLEQKLASHKILLTNLYAQLDSQLSTSSRLLDRSIHSEAAKQSIEDLVKAQNALVLAISNSKNVENSIINNNDQSPLPNTSNISPTSALESNELITTSVLEIDDDSDLEGDLDEEIDPEDPGASSAGSDELVQTNETVSRAQSVTTAESITGIEHITTLNLPDIILADGDADATSDIVGDSGIGGTLLNDFANDLMFSEPGFDFNNNGGGETNSVDDIVNGFDLGGFMDNNLQTHRKENGEVNTPDPTKDPNQLNQLDEDTIDLSLDDF
ncbi:hypothetical protein HK100_006190 [Physocladia obscura]|uniref:Uncharacterized protein n=1 Tax=Physocladia obscura TaxID=109957 RepID=A0AAD5T668_9FUNG|nr:hypothetical protein HK100_006190 [Physocladia obscura]